jgi:hypothetical protein
MAKNAQGRLGDIHGLVADAFEVIIDARDGQDETQVNSHRLLQRQQTLHAIVDLDLHFVDRVFFLQHGLCQTLVGVQHCVHCLMHGTFGQARHPEQPLLQFFEIMFEVSFHNPFF